MYRYIVIYRIPSKSNTLGSSSTITHYCETDEDYLSALSLIESRDYEIIDILETHSILRKD